MSANFKKRMIAVLAFTLAAASLSACAKPNQAPGSSAPVSSEASSAGSSEQQSSSSSVSSEVSSAASGLQAASESTSSQDEATQKTLLLSMQSAAKQGKVLNIDFPVKDTVFDDVQSKWGKEDKSEYIADAKGTYATYAKRNAVFGYNKGSQLFEVRSSDSGLKGISMSQVKKVYGDPAYDKKVGSDEILGYVVTKEFKILLVFPQPKSASDDPKLDHYSVFYPRGTVNSMADDPGREW